jgi:hypothetical protein
VAAITVHRSEQSGSRLDGLLVSLVRIAKIRSRGREAAGGDMGFISD